MKKIKKWWRNLCALTCDYCGQKAPVWYEASMFPVQEYKGEIICKECVKDMAKNPKNKITVI